MTFYIDYLFVAISMAYVKLVEEVLNSDISRAKEVNYIIKLDYTLRGLTFSLEGFSVPAIVKNLIQVIFSGK